MAFFERTDIHCIAQVDIDEIEGRHSANYLQAVIDRQTQIIRTYLRNGGYNVEEIFNEQTNKDAVVMDILDAFVSYVLNYSYLSRSSMGQDLLSDLTKMYHKKMQMLKEITQNLMPIATELPDKPQYPSASDERKSKGVLGYDDRINDEFQIF